MLRYAFLPSDFHPQFLILGDRADIGGLVAMLRTFAEGPASTPVAHQAPSEPAHEATLTLLPHPQTTGLHRGNAAGAFEWRLDERGAALFADMIEEMLAEPEPAGSIMLEVRTPEEIPVKVSRGEFTENFLIDEF